MRKYTQFYIDGKWIDPLTPNSFDVTNPADETIAGVISLGSKSDVDKAVVAARGAFTSFSRFSRQERLELLENILNTYNKYYDDIALAISEEMGAPLPFSIEDQASCGTGHLQAAINALKSFQFEEDKGSTRVYKEPIGVCAFITPWNWPINQITCKVAPAVATGCTMLLKPSEIAPFSAYLFSQVMDEAGVPGGVFNMINGDGPTVGTAMAEHPDVDMVSFTGSTRAGILVAKAAADSVKRVTQELGGKSANIILDDADLEKAVRNGVIHCFSNSGQSCNAPTRMLVPKISHDLAANIAVNTANTVVVGDPKADDTVIGPVVSKLHFDKIQNLIQQGIEEGVELACGGTGKPEHLERGYYIKPTIFVNVNNASTIAQQEIFGPVLAIIPYQDETEAIQIANDTPYGLSGYVSGSHQRALDVASRLRTGMVHINGAEGSFDTPFGGYKQSGNGREFGEYGFEDYLEIKAVMGVQN
ncbi:MAG: aldehyde dehydrogenase family protein [Pseudomonadales bacterium]|jgi:aldehyde dehydrogenase (NAD+)|nr:aldehyde dehydrogenase family protein [Pseudomonadales bacterium]|tara:strand:+ start:275 stop:1699 length:1425 start_codon:yes stop_codon:yes gene_type:complete